MTNFLLMLLYIHIVHINMLDVYFQLKAWEQSTDSVLYVYSFTHEKSVVGGGLLIDE